MVQLYRKRLIAYGGYYFNTSYVMVQHYLRNMSKNINPDFNTSYVMVQPPTALGVIPI